MLKQSKKTIFINRYFYPDHSATSQMLGDLAFYLAGEGENIAVVTSRQRYDGQAETLASYEKIQGVHVYRIWTSSFGRGNLLGRSLDYLTFYFCAFFRLLVLVSRGDVVVAKTDPPLISVVAMLVCMVKGAKLVNWLQDLFPEVAVSVQGLKIPGFVHATLKAIRNSSLRFADLNVAIGHIMKVRLQNEGVSANKITVTPNWSDIDARQTGIEDDNPLRVEWGLSNKFVVGYSGNLGRAHEFDTFLDAAEQFNNDPDISFLIVGGGARLDYVKDQVEKRNIKNFMFKDYQPRDILAYSLAVPDVHVVSLLPEFEGLIVPSKFYGVAAVGRPTLFIGSAQGELGILLENHQCGFAISAGDVVYLVERISALKNNPSQKFKFGQNALAAYIQFYTKAASLELWKKNLN